MTERFHGGAGCSNFASAGNQMGTEDDTMIAIVMSEEYANLDESVGPRLSHLSSIPVSFLFGVLTKQTDAYVVLINFCLNFWHEFRCFSSFF